MNPGHTVCTSEGPWGKGQAGRTGMPSEAGKLQKQSPREWGNSGRQTPRLNLICHGMALRTVGLVHSGRKQGTRWPSRGTGDTPESFVNSSYSGYDLEAPSLEI